MKKIDKAGYYGSNGQINAYIVLPGMEVPYYAADGDTTDLQTKLTTAQTELKRLNGLLATSQANYNDANGVCQTQDCTEVAKNIVKTEMTNIFNYTAQIKVQADLVKSLTDSLTAANKAITDPAIIAANSAAKIASDNAALQKVRTMWIAGIAGAVVVLGVLKLMYRK